MGNLWEQHGIFTTNYMEIYGVSWKLPVGYGFKRLDAFKIWPQIAQDDVRNNGMFKETHDPIN